MDFGKVFSRAWQIIWKNKVLWIFGILASCGTRYSSNFGGNTNYQMDSGEVGNLPPQMQRWFIQMERWFNSISPDQIVLYVLIFIAIVLLLSLIVWLIATYGRVGLIKGTLLADAGKKLTFGMVSREGAPVYWRAVGLSAIFGLINLAVVIILVGFGLLVGIGTAGIGFLCLIPLACLLVLPFIAYAVYIQIANVALVKENLGIGDAIRRGWEVFRSNFGNIALMALILFVGGIIASIIIAIPAFVAFTPLLYAFLGGTERAFAQGIWIFVACLVIAIPFILLFNGILSSYIQAAWTLTYTQLTAVKKAVARTKRARA